MYKHATTFLDMDFIIFEGQLKAKNGHGGQLDTKNQQNLTHYNYATFFFLKIAACTNKTSLSTFKYCIIM